MIKRYFIVSYSANSKTGSGIYNGSSAITVSGGGYLSRTGFDKYMATEVPHLYSIVINNIMELKAEDYASYIGE